MRSHAFDQDGLSVLADGVLVQRTRCVIEHGELGCDELWRKATLGHQVQTAGISARACERPWCSVALRASIKPVGMVVLWCNPPRLLQVPSGPTRSSANRSPGRVPEASSTSRAGE